VKTCRPPLASLIWNAQRQEFVKKLTKQHTLSDGLAVYRRLQSDDQDSVRLLTVEDLIAIAQQLTAAEVKEQLLKQIRQTVSDKSWRVRYMAATHFNEVISLAPFPLLYLNFSS
jgi:methionine salvage enolase-phosphatase E1